MSFKIARWTVLAFVGTTALAMLMYPGGTIRNPDAVGYAFSQNTLSDLGMTVTWGGHANHLVASIFVLSVVFLVLALTPCFRAFVTLYSTSARSRKWTRAAAVSAAIAGIGFIAVAVTPADRLFGIHIRGVYLAFEATLLTTLFLSFATARDSPFPRQVPAAWFLLTLLLSGYVMMLAWGPGLDTDRGLIMQVVAQKITVATALLIVAYQSSAAERVATDVRYRRRSSIGTVSEAMDGGRS